MGGALQGLVGGGVRPGGRAAQWAAAFLARWQKADGGFRLTPGGQSTAQSAAWAVQLFSLAAARPAGVTARRSRTRADRQRPVSAARRNVRDFHRVVPERGRH
jgi:hypothetical protein